MNFPKPCYFNLNWDKHKELDYINNDVEYSEEGQRYFMMYYSYSNLDTVEKAYSNFIKYADSGEIDLTFNDNIMFKTALYKGNIDIIKYYIDENVDVSCCDNYAIKMVSFQPYKKFKKVDDQLKLLQILIDNGADIRANNNFPLMAAVFSKNVGVVKFLLEKGIDPNDNDLIVDVLTESIDINSDSFFEILKILVENGLSLEKGSDIFRSAAVNGQVDALEYLIEMGINPNCILDSDLYSILMTNSFETIKLLADNGVDFNLVDERRINVEDNYLYQIYQILVGNNMDPELAVKIVCEAAADKFDF